MNTMYLMQTVSTGPANRSYQNQKNFDEILVMNDSEDISKYSDGTSHYRSPTLAKRSNEPDEIFIDQKSPTKKDKKWSIGGLFRRKKKDADSESSSDDETPQKKGFLQRRRHKKDDKRKRKLNKTIGTFDHIVISPNSGTNGFRPVRDYEDIDGVLSDPNLRLADHDYPKIIPYGSHDKISWSKESINKNRLEISNSRGSLQSSLDSQGKKRLRDRVKAFRDQLKNDSSSDEGSQKSNASSANRFRSDESLTKSQNGSLSRKTRSARTERYIKRLTKEEENVLNKEAELEQQRLISNENKQRWVPDNGMGTPTQKLTGLSTIPPSHNIQRAYSNLSESQRNYINQNTYQNVTRKPEPQSQQRNPIYQNAKNDYLSDHRSYSFDCNINRSPMPQDNEVMHVKFPLGRPVPKPRNPTMINQYSSNQSLQKNPPPPPPPRDPQRKVYNYQFDSNNRPMSYAFENGSQRRSSIGQTPMVDKASIPRLNSYQYNQNINRSSSFGWQPNYRSNSEDHIAQANNYLAQNRPASATPDMQQQRYIKRQPRPDQYQYFADKSPRSRKPIHITSPQGSVTQLNDQPYLSDSQMLAKIATSKTGNSASEFWKQKDMEETKRRSQLVETVPKVMTKKDEVPFTKNAVTRTASHSDINLRYPRPIETPRPQEIKYKVELPNRHSSGSSVEQSWIQDEEERKRRSSNLEEALDELEAIYKSLRLGDEDLLDRAERRDVPAAAQKLLNQENFTKWNNPKEVQSDSGYNYDIDTVDGLLPKKREKRVPNKLNDDMAYRRFCKDRSTSSESPVPQLSYLLTSPLLGDIADDISEKGYENKNEPDITLDDVVYRNLKHANNFLKVADPQPPFGIPIGPISAAPNSDYLHAVPENHYRSRFVPQKSPDIVKDDLAYRTLRKDNSKDPSLPHLGPEDFINNNSQKQQEQQDSKKKKAVRSMSANIYNIMNRNYMEEENEFDKTQSLTDIADAMEIAHRVLREHNMKMFSKMNSSSSERKSPKRSTNTPTSTETLTESKSNLENESPQKMRAHNVTNDVNENGLLQKPPICRTPDKKSRSATKESTPVRVSPGLEENSLDKSQLEELLTALAIEAQETSEKLGNDLRLLDEETSRKCTPRSATPCKEEKFPFKTTDEKLSDIDAVSEHAKLCEKLLEAVVESTELIAPKIPEINVSKEADLTEEVDELNLEPSIYKSVANVIVTRKADLPIPAEPRPELYSESDHDYDNVSNVGIKMEVSKEKVAEEPKKVECSSSSDEKTLVPDQTSKCVLVTSCCKAQNDSKEGNFCVPECLKSTNRSILNDNLITPSQKFVDFSLTNYDTKHDCEHSSGFHTDSNGSSPDFSLENVDISTENDIKINFNNEICTFVSNTPLENSSHHDQNEFSSISSTGSNSAYKDITEIPEPESEYSSFIYLDNDNFERTFLESSIDDEKLPKTQNIGPYPDLIPSTSYVSYDSFDEKINTDDSNTTLINPEPLEIEKEIPFLKRPSYFYDSNETATSQTLVDETLVHKGHSSSILDTSDFDSENIQKFDNTVATQKSVGKENKVLDLVKKFEGNSDILSANSLSQSCDIENNESPENLEKQVLDHSESHSESQIGELNSILLVKDVIKTEIDTQPNSRNEIVSENVSVLKDSYETISNINSEKSNKFDLVSQIDENDELTIDTQIEFEILAESCLNTTVEQEIVQNDTIDAEFDRVVRESITTSDTEEMFEELSALSVETIYFAPEPFNSNIPVDVENIESFDVESFDNLVDNNLKLDTNVEFVEDEAKSDTSRDEVDFAIEHNAKSSTLSNDSNETCNVNDLESISTVLEVDGISVPKSEQIDNFTEPKSKSLVSEEIDELSLPILMENITSISNDLSEDKIVLSATSSEVYGTLATDPIDSSKETTDELRAEICDELSTSAEVDEIPVEDPTDTKTFNNFKKTYSSDSSNNSTNSSKLDDCSPKNSYKTDKDSSELMEKLSKTSIPSTSTKVDYKPKSKNDQGECSSSSDKSEKEVSWYKSPINVILACSYAIACAHQLALIDIVTLLGLILAIFTVIAALSL